MSGMQDAVHIPSSPLSVQSTASPAGPSTGHQSPSRRSRAFSSSSTEAFGQALGASFVPRVDVAELHSDPFWGSLNTALFDRVGITELTASGHAVERAQTHIDLDTTSYYKASLQLSGSGFLTQDSQETVLRPGDLVLYDTSRPYSLVFDDDIQLLILMVPKSELRLPRELEGALTPHLFSSDDRLGEMVIPFLEKVALNLDHLGGATGPRLVRTALDLITTMFAYELGLDDEPMDARQALREQIREYIGTKLTEPTLNPQQIATAHYISTRHLHSLFKDEGTTVSTLIRELRLERCRRELADPLLAYLSVGSIAAKWCFPDPAHFSRTFRAAFGLTPRELRSLSFSSSS